MAYSMVVHDHREKNPPGLPDHPLPYGRPPHHGGIYFMGRRGEMCGGLHTTNLTRTSLGLSGSCLCCMRRPPGRARPTPRDISGSIPSRLLERPIIYPFKERDYGRVGPPLLRSTICETPRPKNLARLIIPHQPHLPNLRAATGQIYLVSPGNQFSIRAALLPAVDVA